MKNLKYLSVFILIMLFAVSCSSDDDDGVQAPVNIPTTVEGVEFPFASIEGVTIDGPIDVLLDVDFDEVIKDKTAGVVGLDNVKEAELKEFSVILDDSDFIGDLSAIKDADLYLKSENPDVAEILVAQVKDNTDTEELNFDVVTDENLVDYFKADDTYLVLRNITGGDSSLTTFTVTLKPVWKMSFGL